MEKLHLPRIEALPQALVNPERFAKQAVAQVIQLPEINRIFAPDAA